MKFYIALLATAALSTSAEGKEYWCPNFEHGKKDPTYRRKIAKFYKDLMNSNISITSLIRVSEENHLTPEELISVMDKDYSCDLNQQELTGFVEKWAKKKG